MTTSNYRNLEVWQKTRVLTREIYRASRTFPPDEVFGLTQQMRRAAISILSNIAESQGRWTRRDTRHFLLIARGSCLELEAQVVIAADLGFIAETDESKLNALVLEVTRMLNGLLRYVTKKLSDE